MAAFGVSLIAWGPTLTADRASAANTRFVSEKELFQDSDILSVHLRYSTLSDNFVNATRLSLMKPTALLVDISRAGVVNRQDWPPRSRQGDWPEPRWTCAIPCLSP
jgi:phosphoglycerate dehydrogenase-like enzyme